MIGVLVPIVMFHLNQELNIENKYMMFVWNLIIIIYTRIPEEEENHRTYAYPCIINVLELYIFDIRKLKNE